MNFCLLQRIKLSGFPQALRVRAGEAPIECPRKHDWDAFFRDARDMNELIPGERPDTVIISNLPVRWFADPEGSSKLWPCPNVIKTVFQVCQLIINQTCGHIYTINNAFCFLDLRPNSTSWHPYAWSLSKPTASVQIGTIYGNCQYMPRWVQSFSSWR